MRNFLTSLLVAIATLLSAMPGALAQNAAAQGTTAQGTTDFPNRPIRFVLISSAGSGGDSIARLLSDKMAPILKTTFVLENKPGAAGAIASEIAARAAPDGYTILLGGYTTHVLLPTINPKLAYDAVRDFQPLGRIGTAAIMLMATNDFPANNLKELIAMARARPGLQYASWGNGSTGHFCGELLSQKRQMQMSHVPYKSVAQVVTDMMGGHIKLAYVDMATGSPLVKAGRMKALASCVSRTPNLPELVSYDDEGIDFDGMKVQPPMWGVYAPAATPRPIVDKLSGALKQVLDMPDVKAKLLDYGVTVAFMGGDELRESLKANIESWKAVARAGNITMD